MGETLDTCTQNARNFLFSSLFCASTTTSRPIFATKWKVTDHFRPPGSNVSSVFEEIACGYQQYHIPFPFTFGLTCQCISQTSHLNFISQWKDHGSRWKDQATAPSEGTTPSVNGQVPSDEIGPCRWLNIHRPVSLPGRTTLPDAQNSGACQLVPLPFVQELTFTRIV